MAATLVAPQVQPEGMSEGKFVSIVAHVRFGEIRRIVAGVGSCPGPAPNLAQPREACADSFRWPSPHSCSAMIQRSHVPAHSNLGLNLRCGGAPSSPSPQLAPLHVPMNCPRI